MKKKTNSGSPFRLEALLDYIIASKPKALMKVLYQHGALPYNYQESVTRYLKKSALAIVREDGDEGVKALLAAHPDKNLILDLFSEPGPVTPEMVESSFTGADVLGSSYEPGMPEPQKLVAVLSLALLALVVIYIIN